MSLTFLFFACGPSGLDFSRILLLEPGCDKASEWPYNGQDDDCNPATADDDLDGDGLLVAGDCDDQDPERGGPELPYDNIDQDCDRATPDDDLDKDGSPAADDCDDLHPHRGRSYTGGYRPGLCADYCEVSLLGDLVLGDAQPPVEGFYCVGVTSGALVVEDTTRVRLGWLPALWVSGDLIIRDNPSLSSVVALGSLAWIGGTWW